MNIAEQIQSFFCSKHLSKQLIGHQRQCEKILHHHPTTDAHSKAVFFFQRFWEKRGSVKYRDGGLEITRYWISSKLGPFPRPYMRYLSISNDIQSPFCLCGGITSLEPGIWKTGLDIPSCIPDPFSPTLSSHFLHFLSIWNAHTLNRNEH